MGLGIPHDSRSVTAEKGDVNGSTTEEEQKLVIKELISAYDHIIATRLKAELCSIESNNNNNDDNKRDSPMSSKFSFINFSFSTST